MAAAASLGSVHPVFAMDTQVSNDLLEDAVDRPDILQFHILSACGAGGVSTLGQPLQQAGPTEDMLARCFAGMVEDPQADLAE